MRAVQYEKNSFNLLLELVNKLDRDEMGVNAETLASDLTSPLSNEGRNILLLHFDAGKSGYARLYRHASSDENRFFFITRLPAEIHPETDELDGLIEELEIRATKQPSVPSKPIQLFTNCFVEEENLAAAYERCGYRFQGFFCRLDITNLSNLASPENVNNVKIRLYDTSRDTEELVSLYERIASEKNDNLSFAMPDYQNQTKTQWFQPQLLIVAEKQGKLIGLCWNTLDENKDGLGNRWGVIRQLGVIPQEHEPNLESALLRCSLFLLRDAGANKVRVSREFAKPDANNDLYERNGFKERYVLIGYSKTLSPQNR